MSVNYRFYSLLGLRKIYFCQMCKLPLCKYILKTSCLLFSMVLLSSVGEPEEQGIKEKQLVASMRMIGHQVALCYGDATSRILPIEKESMHYKISFENKLEIDPDNIISIVGDIMKENNLAEHYIVETKQCETKDIVHSYEVRKSSYQHLIPCTGRILPKDCYELYFISLDHISPESYMKKSYVKKRYIPLLLLLILPLVFFFIYGKYDKTRKNLSKENINSHLIGATRFNKNSMTLSHDGVLSALSHKEVELLALLYTHINEVVERDTILKNVWADDGDYIGRTLDVFISKLRKKLTSDDTIKIVNVRGVGYKLVTQN